MKLTKISYISLLIASLVAAPSCTGVLDTPPTTSPSESIFWQSK